MKVRLFSINLIPSDAIAFPENAIADIENVISDTKDVIAHPGNVIVDHFLKYHFTD